MRGRSLDPRRLDDHVFGQDRPRDGERGTAVVFAPTLVFMVVEVAAGAATRARTRRRSASPPSPTPRPAGLHVRTIAPGPYAAASAVVTREPRPPEHDKRRVPDGLGAARATVEVHRRPDRRDTPPHAA